MIYGSVWNPKDLPYCSLALQLETDKNDLIVMY